MSKFLNNHPSALETLILYDIEKWRTADRSYRNLCEMIGEDAISEQDFIDLYRKMCKKSAELTSNIINDIASIRLCIFSDAIFEKMTVGPSFDAISKQFGLEPSDFPSFAYWHHHFRRGNRQLERKSFSDLPFDVLGTIVEKLDFKSQSKLLRVSRGMQSVVNQSVPSIRDIRIDLYSNGFSIYPYESDGKLNMWPFYYLTSDIRRKGFDLIAFGHLERLLSNRRLKLNVFRYIDSVQWMEFDGKIKELLGRLVDRPISIRKLSLIVRDEQIVYDLMKSSRKLEEVDVWINDATVNIDRMAELKTWQEMKHVAFRNPPIPFSTHFLRFDTFDVTLDKITVKDLVEIKQVDLAVIFA
uniref:F-box domain-containing protein n=1 Tax=Caenorhabditis tropicalis TaxID=1561998 RepID=A0A1I7UV35_9PELO